MKLKKKSHSKLETWRERLELKGFKIKGTTRDKTENVRNKIAKSIKCRSNLIVVHNCRYIC